MIVNVKTILKRLATENNLTVSMRTYHNGYYTAKITADIIELDEHTVEYKTIDTNPDGVNYLCVTNFVWGSSDLGMGITMYQGKEYQVIINQDQRNYGNGGLR